MRLSFTKDTFPVHAAGAASADAYQKRAGTTQSWSSTVFRSRAAALAAARLEKLPT
jgi:hypothetical protein